MLTIKKSTMSNQVLLYLRKEIMLHKLKDGYHLKESEIAAQLNVSRGPIREALTQLQKENLVEKRLNGRTVVGKFERKDIEDLYNSRILLEKAALAETNMKTFHQHLDKFYDYIKLMEDPNVKNDDETDLAFHELIIQLPANKTLQQLWSSLNGITLTLMDITNEYLSLRQEAAINEHIAIIENMERGKVRDAQQALETHLTRAANHFMNAVNDITLGGEVNND
ncbi:GntR family transcriptional regulator [Oceanobacillus longus]|uniref:GntR family transcriptional regulator n=1 Tax=Oceanobacillus longus TaxID=930120 RepID=A0ABV8H1X9_9BACI